MSDVFEYLGTSGFKKSILSNEYINFIPFFDYSQNCMRESFGEDWVYGIDKNDDADAPFDASGFLVYRKKLHVHEFKCDCGEKALEELKKKLIDYLLENENLIVTDIISEHNKIIDDLFGVKK